MPPLTLSQVSQDLAGVLPVPGSKASPVLTAQETARRATSLVSFSLVCGVHMEHFGGFIFRHCHETREALCCFSSESQDFPYSSGFKSWGFQKTSEYETSDEPAEAVNAIVLAGLISPSETARHLPCL